MKIRYAPIDKRISQYGNGEKILTKGVKDSLGLTLAEGFEPDLVRKIDALGVKLRGDKAAVWYYLSDPTTLWYVKTMWGPRWVRIFQYLISIDPGHQLTGYQEPLLHEETKILEGIKGIWLGSFRPALRAMLTIMDTYATHAGISGTPLYRLNQVLGILERNQWTLGQTVPAAKFLRAIFPTKPWRLK